MSRWRITVRGEDCELRGYLDVSDRTDQPNRLVEFSDAMKPYGIVLASPAPDYEPLWGE